MKASNLWLIFFALTPLFRSELAAQENTSNGNNRFIGISAGIGVGAHTATSIVDYINAVAQPVQGQRLDDFTSAVEIFIVPELQIADEWSAALEYSLLLKSYSLDNRNRYSKSEFSYQVHMPTLLIHHLVLGDGYRLKFGGGAGYYFSDFDQRFPEFSADDSFKARGLGFKLDAVGHTQFDETFYGSIGVDLRWVFLGALKRGDGSSAVERTENLTPKMNFFSLGLKFGVMFHLN